MSSPSTTTSSGASVIRDYGANASTCGYCKSSTRSSVTHGLMARSLTVQDYQDLLDRGWRRSGVLVYKPKLAGSCCPLYTIRLKASSFVASKEQLRVLRRMQRFLEEDYRGPESKAVSDPDEMEEACAKVFSGETGKPAVQSNRISVGGHDELELFNETSSIRADLCVVIQKALESVLESTDAPSVVVRPVSASSRGKWKNVTDDVLFTSSVAYAVAAQLKSNGTRAEGSEQERVSNPSPTEVAELLVSRIESSPYLHGLQAQASKGHLNFIRDHSEGSNDLLPVCLPCKQLHSADHSGCSRKVLHANPDKLLKKHKLEMSMRRSAFDSEEFNLYRKYQTRVHNERPQSVTEASYKRFLVTTPVIAVPPAEDGSTPSCGFGSFHQQYRLDGQLVAVGVVDILPNCLSSKYLFWNPDFAFLSLGKFTALQEIKWVQREQKLCPSLEYYYMGYYVHSCPKMRYKASYRPSELLCPADLSWVPFSAAEPLIEERAVTRLCGGVVTSDGMPSINTEDEVDIFDSPCLVEDIIDEVPLMLRQEVVFLKDLKALNDHEIIADLCEALRQYTKLVGPAVAARMLYCL